jgi:polyadenylate-binding protein
MWSHRDPSLRKSGLGNIFVKNLDPDIDNKTLFDTFSLFGNILSCKVATDKNRKSLGYGFVHYESEEAAKAAIAKVNGKVLGSIDGKVISGFKIIVTPFKSKRERGELQVQFTNVYLKNIPIECTEADLRARVESFGEVTSLHMPMDAEKKFRGFAFVNFKDPNDAANAVEGLNGMEWNGRELYAGRAQKKEEREKELRNKFELKRMERAKKYDGVNVYVKNLSDEINDDRLLQEFSKFGTIESAKVMEDAHKKSKGFGFVCFSSPDEATKAVSGMNGQMLDGKPLYVALAQRKEIRKAALEAQYVHRAKMGLPHQQPMFPHTSPMFYQGMPQRAMMYPPQQMLPRTTQFPRGPTQLMGLRGPVTHQLMPVQPRGPGGPAGQRRRGPGGRQGGQGQGQQGGGRQGQGPATYKYNSNVRNQQQPMNISPPQEPRGEMPHPAPGGPSRIVQETVSLLSNAPEDQKKQILGERLFPMIEKSQGARAGKITGMLLEMDNNELINLLESKAALHEKIEEALEVLGSAEE